MARSYKKHPVCTDGHRRTTKETKQIANRCVRHRNKRIVKGYLDEDPRYEDILTLDQMSYKRFFCSYNIHDYISYWPLTEAICDYEHPHWIYSPWSNEYYHAWDNYKTLEEFLNYWEKCMRRK